MPQSKGSSFKEWRERVWQIIFLSDTPEGKVFDLILIALILTSVILVMLESIPSVRQSFPKELIRVEWIITILFLIEYAIRVFCVSRVGKYVFSFFGIIDFLSVVPSFLELFIPGVHYLTVLRILRVLRVFRVLKLVKYMEEAAIITTALNKSRRKITVFLFAILTIVTILGSLIYVIEGEENGFTSIPRSVYWAIVTLTTVGYGDISPQTAFGQALASIIMIMGYGMIAVPTGFVTAEISQALNKKTTKKCIKCGKITEVEEARYCKHCGIKLELTKSEN